IREQAIAPEQLFQGIALSLGEAREQALITRGRQTWCGNNSHDAARTPQGTDAPIGSVIHQRFYRALGMNARGARACAPVRGHALLPQASSRCSRLAGKNSPIEFVADAGQIDYRF